MPRLVQTGDELQINLLRSVADLIAVRNYLMSIYNTKVERTLYKRIDEKLIALDKQIINLALMIEPAFKIEP